MRKLIELNKRFNLGAKWTHMNVHVYYGHGLL